MYGIDKATATILKFIANSNNGWDTCLDKTGPSISLTTDEIRNAIIDAKFNRGLKIRAIADITKENIEFCKDFVKIITELRHHDRVKGSFSISETEYIATEGLKESKSLPEVIYSNVKNIVHQNQYLFDILWSKSIPAEQRFNEIENDPESPIVEIIHDSIKSKERYRSLVNMAKKEIIIILPTLNTFKHHVRIGIINALRETALRHQVQVKILMPLNDINNNTPSSITNASEKEINQIWSHHKNDQDKVIINDILSENIEIRHIENSQWIKATIIVIDKKYSFVSELKDHSKNSLDQAIGSSIYSNSKPDVLSYVSIFDMLWLQSELFAKLKAHDVCQKEFFDIVSHELRTPTQAILGYSGILKRHPEKGVDLVDNLYANAKRLQRLIGNMLDVIHIENNSLRLYKRNIKLNELNDILCAITRSYRLLIKQMNKDIELNYLIEEKYYKDKIQINIDIYRITQVLSNLLSNAIKFTNHGSIQITCVLEMDIDNQRYRDWDIRRYI